MSLSSPSDPSLWQKETRQVAAGIRRRVLAEVGRMIVNKHPPNYIEHIPFARNVYRSF